MGNTQMNPSGHRRPRPPAATRFKRTQKKKKPIGEESAGNKLPQIVPRMQCRLRHLKLERTLDWLLLEEEFHLRCKRNKHPSQQQITETKQMEAMCGTPMGIGTVEELPDDDHAIIHLDGSGRSWYVPILTLVDKDLISLHASILCKMAHGSRFTPLAVCGVLPHNGDVKSDALKMEKAPSETYEDIGGHEQAIQEVKEAVELPLTSPELYEEMGIKPPHGIILYGPPGTGKTLMAKAVANKTAATFIRCVGSQLIQKHSGDGPKLVRQMFQMAKDNAPSIIFFDEIDSVGSKRYDTSSAGEREVQRTMLELLNQLDGFESRGDVKIIMATNRIDKLDPALIRPGRIDRKIEVGLPDEKTRMRIFDIHTRIMTLGPNVTYKSVFTRGDLISGAEIKAICTEAGLYALRERRKQVSIDDFNQAVDAVVMKKNDPFTSVYL